MLRLGLVPPRSYSFPQHSGKNALMRATCLIHVTLVAESQANAFSSIHVHHHSQHELDSSLELD